MSDRNKDSVNNLQKSDNSAIKPDINERRQKESVNLESKPSHKDIIRQGMDRSTTNSKYKHSNSPTRTQSSTSESDILRHPSIHSADDRDSDNVAILHTTTDISSSHETSNDSTSTSTVAIGASVPCSNAFANDGSFMAMFRKKVQEEQMNKESNKGVKRPVEVEEKEKASPKPGSSFNLPLVGRRKGPKMLKTGVVAKKLKEEEKEDDANSDAWSKYLAEVRKYKSQKCIEDDGGSTPLVK